MFRSVRLYGTGLHVHTMGYPTMPSSAIQREYDARVDAKRRLTIRGAIHEYFRVVHRKDGTILLKPRALVDAPVSGRTLRAMDAAMKNLRAGKQSKPVDLKKLAAMKL
jgi:hypothetical protein